MATSAISLRRGSTQADPVWIEQWAARLGLVVVFMSQVPLLETTGPGQLLRACLLLIVLGYVALHLHTATARLTQVEWLGIGMLFLLPIFGTLIGFFTQFTPSAGEILKFAALPTVCFLLARLIATEKGCHRALRYYYWLCLFAAVQAIVAIGFDVLGIRQLHAIPLRVEADARYFLPWYGLIGADVGNYRTNFYFSEASFFAHMLLPGIAYAVAMQRGIGMLLLIAGFATTSAAAASAALAIMLFLFMLRLRISLGAIIITGMLILAAAIIAFRMVSDIQILIQLFDRTTSVSDKLDTFTRIKMLLGQFPFGIGPVNMHATFGQQVNTSSGLFQMFIGYGVQALPLVFLLVGGLLRIGLLRPAGGLSAAMAISLLASMAAGITHGPLLKYYAVFLLGITLTLHRLEAERVRTPAGAE